VDKIKQELDEQGAYTIEKLGRFTKDQSGIIRFIQDPAVADLIPDEKPDEDSGLLDIDSEASSEETIPADEKKEGAPGEIKKTPASKDKKWSKPEDKKEETQAYSAKSASDGKGASSEEEKIAASGGGTTTTHHDNTLMEERRGWPWWLILLIILIPVALVLVYFLLIKNRTTEEETLVPVEIEVVDTIVKNPVVDSAAINQQEQALMKETAGEETETTKKEEVKSGPRHHIIVGSFRHENNAYNLMKKLKEKGYQDAFVFKHNNLFMVSAASYESLIDARKAQEMFVQKEKMENWILTRR
jgi:hypothetical protein